MEMYIVNVFVFFYQNWVAGPNIKIGIRGAMFQKLRFALFFNPTLKVYPRAIPYVEQDNEFL